MGGSRDGVGSLVSDGPEGSHGIGVGYQEGWGVRDSTSDPPPVPLPRPPLLPLNPRNYHSGPVGPRLSDRRPPSDRLTGSLPPVHHRSYLFTFPGVLLGW